MRVINNNILSCNSIKKIYLTGNKEQVVLENFNLTVKEKEFISIIGHSGCGKSTVMSMIAGLNSITEGTIELHGNPIMGAGLDRGVIFQSPTLLPWLTSIENVLLGIEESEKSLPKRKREELASYYLRKVGIEEVDYQKKNKELSEGMKQRIGIARAIIIRPEILLLDEPFGMLDSITREELQDEILKIWEEEEITAIMITHDIDEAIFLSDRVVMMTSGPNSKVGEILEIDLPRPRNREMIVKDPDYIMLKKRLLNFLEH